MSEKVTTSDSELYNNIVEMLSNGNFLQLNGKAINLTELNEYINAQQEEIERLNNIIKEAINYMDDNTYYKDHKGHINIDDLYIILKGVDKG